MLLRALRQSRIKLGFALIAALAVAIFAAAACGGDDNDGNSGDLAPQLEEIQNSLDDLHNSIQRTQVFTVRVAFLEADLHAIDEEMQTASEIPPGFLTRIRQMEQAAASVDWPDELQDLGDDLAVKLADAAAALMSEDLTESKGTVIIAHAAWHAWDGAAVEYLTGEKDAPDDMNM